MRSRTTCAGAFACAACCRQRGERAEEGKGAAPEKGDGASDSQGAPADAGGIAAACSFPQRNIGTHSLHRLKAYWTNVERLTTSQPSQYYTQLVRFPDSRF